MSGPLIQVRRVTRSPETHGKWCIKCGDFHVHSIYTFLYLFQFDKITKRRSVTGLSTRHVWSLLFGFAEFDRVHPWPQQICCLSEMLRREYNYKAPFARCSFAMIRFFLKWQEFGCGIVTLAPFCPCKLSADTVVFLFMTEVCGLHWNTGRWREVRHSEIGQGQKWVVGMTKEWLYWLSFLIS